MSNLKDNFLHYSNPAYIDTVCAVSNARQAARIAWYEKNNRLAGQFIIANEEYQTALRNACARLDRDSPLRAAYLAARNRRPCPVKGPVPDFLRNRVEAEIALLQDNPHGQKALEKMITTGKTYMRTRADLALTLHLPLPEKIWNQIKRSFTR